MSNYHNHWHFHSPGRYYSTFEGETHDGGWHQHYHQHRYRVPAEDVEAGHEHLDGPHGHDHIGSEHTIQPEAPADWVV
jgi:hypothetical protein